jgi:hypothetical protein
VDDVSCPLDCQVVVEDRGPPTRESRIDSPAVLVVIQIAAEGLLSGPAPSSHRQSGSVEGVGAA